MRIPKAQKLANGQWYVQLRINGQSTIVHGATAKEAQSKALAVKNGIISPTPAEHQTLGQIVDAYIDTRSNVLSPATIKGYKTIRFHRFQQYMEREVSSIRWQDAVNREAKVCSAKTLRNAWGLIKSALADAGLDVPDVNLPMVTKTPMPWLTPEQIPVFLDAVHGESCELPALLALCSLRRSEVFGLDWADIDIERNCIHVHDSVVQSIDGIVHKPTTKTVSSTRTVPIIIPRLREVLNGIEDKHGPLVTCFVNSPTRRLNNICARAGLPEVGLHGLRRSFASLGYHLGLSELEIMAIGGWSDFQTVHKFYLYLSEQDKARSADKLTAFFAENTPQKCSRESTQNSIC